MTSFVEILTIITLGIGKVSNLGVVSAVLEMDDVELISLQRFENV